MIPVEAIKDIHTETGKTRQYQLRVWNIRTIPASDGGDYPVALQVLRIGKIALVGFPGEMFNEIGVKAIEESPLEDTLWVNLVWTREGQQQHIIPLIRLQRKAAREEIKNICPG